MFQYRQHLRRWSVGVLWAWLFALGVGVASSCVAAPIGDADHAGSSATAAQAQAVHDAHDDGDVSHVDASCRVLCDKSSTGASTYEKFAKKFGAADAATLASLTCLPVSTRPPESALVATHAGPRTTVSLPIALLRLAL